MFSFFIVLYILLLLKFSDDAKTKETTEQPVDQTASTIRSSSPVADQAEADSSPIAVSEPDIPDAPATDDAKAAAVAASGSVTTEMVEEVLQSITEDLQAMSCQETTPTTSTQETTPTGMQETTPTSTQVSDDTTTSGDIPEADTNATIAAAPVSTCTCTCTIQLAQPTSNGSNTTTTLSATMSSATNILAPSPAVDQTMSNPGKTGQNKYSSHV